MTRGNEKKCIFIDDYDRQRYLTILLETKEKMEFDIYAYCLMNNHVHLLIKEYNDNLSDIMHSINMNYARFFNSKYDRVGHLFQGRYKSEIIDTLSYLLTVTRYIHNNPVKAKIVKRPHQYKWSSYSCYLEKYIDNSIVNTDFILGIFSENLEYARTEFINFSNIVADDKVMDIEDDKEKIKTKEEALEYIVYLLKSNNMSLDDLNAKTRKIKGTIIEDIIYDLKEKSMLSYKDLAQLFKVSKSTINRILKH
jgi:REP element-mobilizing transposase RayT